MKMRGNWSFDTLGMDGWNHLLLLFSFCCCCVFNSDDLEAGTTESIVRTVYRRQVEN